MGIGVTPGLCLHFSRPVRRDCAFRRFLNVFALGWLILTLTRRVVFAGSFTAYGPETHRRSTGAPTTIQRSFSVLNPSTTFTIRIRSDGVSSAVISMNGVVVVGPSDFNQ